MFLIRAAVNVDHDDQNDDRLLKGSVCRFPWVSEEEMGGVFYVKWNWFMVRIGDNKG